MAALGCAPKEPVGPVEQIGKGIDQMTKGIRQLESDNQDTDAYKARQREQAIRDSRTSQGLDTDSAPGEWESYEEWQKRKGYR